MGCDCQEEESRSAKAQARIVPGGVWACTYELNDWTPSEGFPEITFPMRVYSAPDAAGWFFACQFSWVHGGTGYIGIRPRSGGKSLAAFSVFGSGAEVVDSTVCKPGADGGAGVSCSGWTDLVHGRWYNLHVKHDPSDRQIWRGSAEDTVTGQTWQLGAWRVPDAWGTGLRRWQAYFAEYYLNLPDCGKLPYMEVEYGTPSSLELGGKMYGGKHYGRCKDQVQCFWNKQSEGSFLVRAGFPSARSPEEGEEKKTFPDPHPISPPARGKDGRGWRDILRRSGNKRS